MRSTPLFVGGLVETYMQTDDRSRAGVVMWVFETGVLLPWAI